MKKILFHHNCLEQGGAERVISNLANQFCKEGYEVIVATEWQGEKEFELNTKVRRIHVGLDERQDNKSRFFKAYIRVVNLRRLIKAEKPDVAIGFTRKPIYRLLMAVKGVRVPTIIAVRTNPVGYYDSFIDKVCRVFLLPRADGAVFQTEGQKAFFPDKLQKKSTIILNPINDKFLHASACALKEKCIVHSGRLDKYKNQPLLVSAFIKFHEKHPDYCLKIYGPDSGDGTKQKLESMIYDNNACEYIKLMGGCDELETVLPRGEVYAFSSDCEGLPNALLEAMCLGMPIVSTDCPCGGPRTVITDEVSGLLVPVGDEKAMSEALCKMVENPAMEKSMGDNARKISDRLTVEAISNQWKDYMLDVIKKSSAGR